MRSTSLTGYNPVVDCIFCKIVAGEIPSYKVWENDKFVAFLDIFPARYGQTIVASKTHMPSYIFSLPANVRSEAYEAAAEVARKLDGSLGAVRTCQLMEGLGVDHLHLKLYPVMPGEDKEGLIPLGSKLSESELAETASKIREGGSRE